MTEPIPENLLREPLEYLFADHVRLQSFCEALGTFAENLDGNEPLESDADVTLETILAYLRDELPRHIADEELDVIPRLKLRAEPEDGLGRIIEHIDNDHAEEEDLTEILVRELGNFAEGAQPRDPKALAGVARHFAQSHCNHLKWENTVLLPLARKRLTVDDQAQIGRTMAKRRGIPYPD